jgi:hypothetical protein
VPVADIVDYLDQHQGAAAVILTAALVLVTIYYAIQNRRMVVEMRRTRGLAILPKLALDFHRLGPTAVTLAIKNVGPGAALAVDVKVVWEPLATGERTENRWRRNVLAPGEQADFMPPGTGLNGNIDSLPKKYRRVRLVGTMVDAAGEKHDVSEVFDELPEWRKVLGDAHQRFVAADTEKRLAEALYKQFETQLKALVAGTSEVARAVQRLAPSEGEDDD